MCREQVLLDHVFQFFTVQRHCPHPQLCQSQAQERICSSTIACNRPASTCHYMCGGSIMLFTVQYKTLLLECDCTSQQVNSKEAIPARINKAADSLRQPTTRCSPCVVLRDDHMRNKHHACNYFCQFFPILFDGYDNKLGAAHRNKSDKCIFNTGQHGKSRGTRRGWRTEHSTAAHENNCCQPN